MTYSLFILFTRLDLFEGGKLRFGVFSMKNSEKLIL